MAGSALLVFLASCTSPTQVDTLTASDLTALQQNYMTSYYALDGSPSSDARTTITVGSTRSGGTIATSKYPTGVAFTAVASYQSWANFPASGQTTNFRAVRVSTNPSVYLVSASTAFSSSDARATYLEEYYVNDVGIGSSTADGQWTSDDPIGTWDGATFTVDPKARKTMTLTFDSGALRDERVLDNTSATPSYLKASMPTGGTLELVSSSVPATVASGIQYSSVTVYATRPSAAASFWFWLTDSQVPTVVGLRYYTEPTANPTSTWTSVSFERTVRADVDLSSLSLADATALVFNGQVGSTVYTTLTKTVLRESASTRRMQMVLTNEISGLEYVLQQLDSNYVAWTGTR